MWQSYVRSGCIEKPKQQLQQPRACGERAQEPLAACRSFGCSSRFASSTWAAAAGRRMAAARWRPPARSTRAWYVVINSALWNRSRRPIANWNAAWSAFLSRNSPCEVLSIARCHGSLESIGAAQAALPSRIQVEAELKGLFPGANALEPGAQREPLDIVRHGFKPSRLLPPNPVWGFGQRAALTSNQMVILMT